MEDFRVCVVVTATTPWLSYTAVWMLAQGRAPWSCNSPVAVLGSRNAPSISVQGDTVGRQGPQGPRAASTLNSFRRRQPDALLLDDQHVRPDHLLTDFKCKSCRGLLQSAKVPEVFF